MIVGEPETAGLDQELSASSLAATNGEYQECASAGVDCGVLKGGLYWITLSGLLMVTVIGPSKANKNHKADARPIINNDHNNNYQERNKRSDQKSKIILLAFP